MVLVRALVVIVMSALAVAALGLAYWAVLTKTIETPYHEMWIGLNARLPAQLREWSCGEVFERLGPGVPPYGCEGLWG